MPGKALARVDTDEAGSLIVSGASSVYANGKSVAFMASVTAEGAAISTSSNSVWIEGERVSRASDLDSQGNAIKTGSDNICVGD